MPLPTSKTVPLLAPGPGRKQASQNLHGRYVEASPRMRGVRVREESEGEGKRKGEAEGLRDNMTETGTLRLCSENPRGSERGRRFTTLLQRTTIKKEKKPQESEDDMQGLLQILSADLTRKEEEEEEEEEGEAHRMTNLPPSSSSSSPSSFSSPSTIPYFFYGTLADTNTLQQILSLPSPPHAQRARILGFSKLLWRHQWTIVRSNGNSNSALEPVYGILYTLSSMDEKSRLKDWAGTTWRSAIVEVEVEIGIPTLDPLDRSVRRYRKVLARVLVLSRFTEEGDGVAAPWGSEVGGSSYFDSTAKGSIDDGSPYRTGTRARPGTRALSDSPSFHLPTVSKRPPRYHSNPIRNTEALSSRPPQTSIHIPTEREIGAIISTLPPSPPVVEFDQTLKLRQLCQSVFELGDEPEPEEEGVKPKEKVASYQRRDTEKALPELPIDEQGAPVMQMPTVLAADRRSSIEKPLPALPREREVVEKGLPNLPELDGAEVDVGRRRGLSNAVATEGAYKDLFEHRGAQLKWFGG